jgi:hypothetical protein
MNFNRINFFICFFTCVTSLSAQMEKRADFYLGSRGEVYFKFPASRIDIEYLADIISVDNFKNDTVYAYANRKEFIRFLKLNRGYTVIDPPGLQHPVKMAQSLKELKDWDSYPTYTNYLDLMESFETNYPELCHIYEIDTSIQGRKILFAKISDNVIQKEAEPEFMFSSSMHGDEVTGYILCLHLIDYLLSNYGTDPFVTRLVDSIEIWINPLANPDGTYHGGDANISDAIRYNANYVDLNRNFPDPEDGQHPDGEAWQLENIAMMNFMNAHNFVFSANYHGGSEVMNYPWDTWFKRHADDTWFQHVSLNYADTVKKYAGSGYFSDVDPSGITDGYDWYTISGGRQDYMTYFRHGREITIEVSGIKMPDASDLPLYWDYNHAAMLHYIGNCLYGIRGTVTDSASHVPLRARIEVIGHDEDSSQIYSDAANGNYHRMIAPGTYDLKFTSPGHKDKVIKGVQVEEYTSQVWLDVELAIGTTPVNIHEIEQKIMFDFSIDRNRNLLLDVPENDNVSITIYDPSGRVLYDTKAYYTVGKYRQSLAGIINNNGIYFCTVRYKGSIKTVKLNITSH